MKKVTSMRDGTRKIRKVKKIRMIQKKGQVYLKKKYGKIFGIQ